MKNIYSEVEPSCILYCFGSDIFLGAHAYISVESIHQIPYKQTNKMGENGEHFFSCEQICVQFLKLWPLNIKIMQSLLKKLKVTISL